MAACRGRTSRYTTVCASAYSALSERSRAPRSFAATCTCAVRSFSANGPMTSPCVAIAASRVSDSAASLYDFSLAASASREARWAATSGRLTKSRMATASRSWAVRMAAAAFRMARLSPSRNSACRVPSRMPKKATAIETSMKASTAPNPRARRVRTFRLRILRPVPSLLDLLLPFRRAEVVDHLLGVGGGLADRDESERPGDDRARHHADLLGAGLDHRLAHRADRGRIRPDDAKLLERRANIGRPRAIIRAVEERLLDGSADSLSGRRRVDLDRQVRPAELLPVHRLAGHDLLDLRLAERLHRIAGMDRDHDVIRGDLVVREVARNGDALSAFLGG